ncbi:MULTISPECIES: nitrate- and nitrite sensing domain-containing protein [unclassified Streptomyces]|uniref:sensor histidine kinase n=1 Tax=unclassified Streptomyces TaxID=2593676 RepID=UPI00202FB301|nr:MULTISPECIES: nitrate- and nitrite sensing domain-containing protein [unclassified Streptomyces]MCM1970234.1 nitrate- and nitrite sensing domain-containing protein [Streptomyces sp. G1]MCX5122265.1 nitrate- and nitrite sensing domain-containing protein [Streptomyces sp. NBC_00347]MCX5295611.1 nitrate- and nitrite sensing domain-containing protein [Streptomyces sp. NBC_00193]
MQGRFKRDDKGSPQARQGRGDAAPEQDPRGGTDRGSSPQHAQNRGPAVESGGPDGSAAVKPKGRAKPKGGSKADDESGSRDVAIPQTPRGSGSRLAMQNWRISTRLVSLLTLPVVAATTLGGFRINDSLNDIAQLEHMQLLTTMTRQATNLAAMLQAERDNSAGPLSVDKSGKPSTLVQGVRDSTDSAVRAFAAATDKVDVAEGNDETLRSIRNNILQIAHGLNNLEEIRKNAYQNGAQQTVTEYNALVVSLLSLSQDMAQATSNPEMIKRTRALAAFSSAKEYASIQRAIIAAALPADPALAGNLTENDRLYARSAQSSEEQARKTFELVYQGKPEELLAALGDGNQEIATADHYARRVLGNKDQFAKEKNRSWMDWYDADDTKLQAMKVIELTLLEDMEQKARELKNESQRDALINGALILLVLGVSLVGAFVMARSMIRSLRRLQDTATRVAQDRLPELVKQLSESDPQDVDTTVESVGLHTRDEIGQVAAAFDDVHREAVRLAAEQALLRGNVNAMFTNLSRRSQGLIQRQLSLISELESREADPDQLSSLFKLDHLATRMRRNGENLLVLAGEEPGRRWTRPVPLVDVLRAAASEVEQYERIELSSVPGTDVAGRVVNDLVHLLAELLENATSFSSPQTKVKVTGHALPDGRVLVEIHDTGIGLSPEDLAAINERLASPPTVDVSVSRRMGLFVVGRLSLRHGIRIQLRPSDSGGTTALVMLPVDVAQGGKKPAPMPGQGGPGGQGAPGAPGQGGPGAQAQGSIPGPGARPPVGAAPQRGQVSAGNQRAALPGRDGGPGGQPQGPGPQGGRPQQQGPGGQTQSAFGSGAPLPGRGPVSGPGGPGGFGGPQARPVGAPTASGPGGFPQGNGFERPQQPQQAQPQQSAQQPAPQQQGQPQAGGPAGRGPRPQLPPRGGAPRPELPGTGGGPAAIPQTTTWGADQRGHDVPRGHDELSGPGSTSEFPRPDFNAPAPQAGGRDNGTTGQFARPEFGDPASTGQFPRQDFGDPASTGQFARQDFQAQRPGGPGVGGYVQPGQAPQPQGNYSPVPTPRAEAPRLPQASRPEALPPAGPGAGEARSPIFDTLESNWFRQEAGQPPAQAPAVPQQAQQSAPAAPAPAAPQRPQQHQLPQRGQEQAPAESAQTATGAVPTVSWRSSPNDELMRQAERVRQPAAGGITTSGLPRRVPRANLVAGTAQQQAEAQAGPQVSRSPDDVRGRLTNLRRGIQQGRQAGTTGPATGSYHIDPTYQQER